MFVVSDSVGAVHEVGTKLCAARWKIRSGFTPSTTSRTDEASRRSHSTIRTLSRKCSTFSVRLRHRWIPVTSTPGRVRR
jgi:hypothetical protein